MAKTVRQLTAKERRDIKLGLLEPTEGQRKYYHLPLVTPAVVVTPLREEGFIISRGKEIPIAYLIKGKKYITSAVSAPTKGRWGVHNDIYFGHFKVGTGEQITKAHIDKGIFLAKASTDEPKVSTLLRNC